MKKYIFLFFLQCLNTNYCQSQQETQKRLEKEKAILVKEIKQINSILFSNNSIKKSALDEIQDLDVKIRVRNKLIKVTNQEINLISKLFAFLIFYQKLFKFNVVKPLLIKWILHIILAIVEPLAA